MMAGRCSPFNWTKGLEREHPASRVAGGVFERWLPLVLRQGQRETAAYFWATTAGAAAAGSSRVIDFRPSTSLL